MILKVNKQFSGITLILIIGLLTAFPTASSNINLVMNEPTEQIQSFKMQNLERTSDNLDIEFVLYYDELDWGVDCIDAERVWGIEEDSIDIDINALATGE